jgi:hypothetical protein
MFTQFWFAGQKRNAISEATFIVERDVGAHAELFVEVASCTPASHHPLQ